MSIIGVSPLAVSMGEPSGIGPDIILSLYADRDKNALPAFIVYGDVGLLRARAEQLELSIYIAETKTHEDFGVFEDALPVRQIGTTSNTPGTLSERNAPVVIESIRQAVADCKAQLCRALVTAPIHKASLYSVGFEHPGHTEFLAQLCAEEAKQPNPVMMLVAKGLRAIPLTIHVPLVEVPKLITHDLIVDTCRVAARDLRLRFNITTPRIGVTGLNPHAGEDASMGLEDRDIIAPAIAQLVEEGIDVKGPLPADTVFHPPHWRQYDVVIAMYHDQALIPVKTIGFDEGVNVTLGLPIVRTSPDHGTALDLAGTGKASTASMLAAIRLADEMSTQS